MGSHYGQLVYLASPLTHDDVTVRQERSIAVARATGWLMTNRRDLFFLSPIAYAHLIAAECTLPFEWHFWAEIDECLLSRCEEFWVLCIPGFKKSTGVGAERKIAERLGLPCRFVIPQTDGSYTVTDEEPNDD
jgi:Domain of unknown function (DUF1937)